MPGMVLQNLAIISINGSGNDLTPIQGQAITWNRADLQTIALLWRNKLETSADLLILTEHLWRN